MVRIIVKLQAVTNSGWSCSSNRYSCSLYSALTGFYRHLARENTNFQDFSLNIAAKDSNLQQTDGDTYREKITSRIESGFSYLVIWYINNVIHGFTEYKRYTHTHKVNKSWHK